MAIYKKGDIVLFKKRDRAKIIMFGTDNYNRVKLKFIHLLNINDTPVISWENIHDIEPDKLFMRNVKINKILK